MNELKPIKLIPTFKDYIWGGNRLVKEYNNKEIICVGQSSSKGSQAGKVFSIEGLFPTLCACTHGYALGYIEIDGKYFPLYDKEEFERIKKAADKIKKDSEILVVIGIGGSYLGARAVIEAINGFFDKNLEIRGE